MPSSDETSIIEMMTVLHWIINDITLKCEKCETINTITLENGELKKLV
jgi:hypothetical protein